MASRISNLIAYKCPLDKSYNHTIAYETEEEQKRFFAQLPKKTFSNQSFMRLSTTSFKVQAYLEEMLQYNYISFTNPATPFDNPLLAPTGKTFYAFLDKVEYLNDNTCELFYTIDVMQTWYFDYDLGESFVEREHTLTDNLYENLVEEDLETGDFQFVTEKDITSGRVITVFCTTVDLGSMQWATESTYHETGDLCFFEFPNQASHYQLQSMQSAWEPASESHWKYTYGELKGNVFNGFKMYAVPASSVEDFANILQGFNTAGKVEAVKQILVCPSDILDDDEENEIQIAIGTKHSGQVIDDFKLVSFYEVNFESFSGHINFNKTEAFNGYGYKPKNNKMYNSQFVKYSIYNNEGGCVELKPEFFKDQPNQNQFSFQIEGCIGAESSLKISPINYMGSGSRPNRVYSLQLSNFPLGSWSYSAYETWFAQNRNAINNQYLTSGLSVVSSVAKAASGALTGNAAGITLGVAGIASSLAAVQGIDAKVNDQRVVPNTVQGQLGDTNVNIANGIKKVVFIVYRIAEEYVRICDKFLSMFGYAIHEPKKPNIVASDAYDILNSESRLRPFYNYIKTQSCVIHQKKVNNVIRGVPADAEAKIAQIFDNGITFWNSQVLYGNKPEWLEIEEAYQGERSATFPIEIGDYSVDNTPLHPYSE